jgi:hypothetical protein
MVDNTKSALEHNIKTKGENSYYYAHAKKFDGNSDKTQGKTFEGEGLIYGGDPVLVGKKSDVPVQVIKPPNFFTKYTFYDDSGFTKIRIEVPENIKSLVTNESIKFVIEERMLDLKVIVPNSEPYILFVKKLYQTIVPAESEAKLIKGNIIVKLKKVNQEEVWEKLSADLSKKDDD